MTMEFNEHGALVSTDYWVAENGRRAGAVWVSVRNNAWHILMPDVPVTRLKRAVAVPVTALRQEVGWQWKLWLKLDLNWALHIPPENFLSGPPSMPPPAHYYETSLQLYGHFLPGFSERSRVTHNFGHFQDEGQVPRLGWCRLLVARVGRNPNWREWVLGKAL